MKRDRSPFDRAATAVAVLALAVWVGGFIALGACAAPLVFRIVPAPTSGDAMGAVFARFDRVAMVAALVVLSAEGIRTWSASDVGTTLSRLRTAAAVVMACLAFYGGCFLSPGILRLHQGGAMRGLGVDGLELERLHHWAELFGKWETLVGLALITVHVLTMAPAPDARRRSAR